MKLPKEIWQIQGKSGGPNILILGGTHGDELTGIAVVKKMLELFGLLGKEPGVYDNDKLVGNLFLGFGNPAAIKQSTRGVGKLDLNRSFAREELEQAPREDDRPDLVRARELLPLMEQVDFLFDIHATSGPSEPFVCFGNDSPIHRELYNLIPIKYILTDPDLVLVSENKQKELATTDYCVNTFGGSEWSEKKYGKRQGIAFCYETGYEKDFSNQDKIIQVLAKLLVKVNVTDKEFFRNLGIVFEDKVLEGQKVFKLADVIIAQEDEFIFAPGMEDNWQLVKKGQLVGQYASGQEERIAADGMYLFPKNSSKIVKGKNIYFLAKEIA